MTAMNKALRDRLIRSKEHDVEYVGKITIGTTAKVGGHRLLVNSISHKGEGLWHDVKITFRGSQLNYAECGCRDFVANSHTLDIAGGKFLKGELNKATLDRIVSTMPMLHNLLVCRHVLAAAAWVVANQKSRKVGYLGCVEHRAKKEVGSPDLA